MGFKLIICLGTQGGPSLSFYSRWYLTRFLVLSGSPPPLFFFSLKVLQKYVLGELSHALRYLASVVSQSFLAFGDILELHRKFLELSGSINRVLELEELLDAAQSGISNLLSPNVCLYLTFFIFSFESLFIPHIFYIFVIFA